MELARDRVEGRPAPRRVVRRHATELDGSLVASLVAPVLRRWPVARAWLFGSVARGTQHPGSDVDIVVELEPGAHLGLGLLQMEDEIAEALGCRADVMTLERAASTQAFLEAYDRDRVVVYERTAG